MHPVLPDFTRVSYLTQANEAWYEAVRQDWQRCWPVLEREKVARGLRPAAYQYITPEELPEIAAWAARHDLVAIPRRVGAVTSTYQSCEPPLVEGAPWQYRVIIARPHPATQLLDALQARNDDRIGELLGYPQCCRDAFASTWGQGQVDSTWEAGIGGPAQTNTWLRWLGLRLLSHLPCRSDCSASDQDAVDTLALAQVQGWQVEADDVLEMLGWPMEWSRLHGVAWIKTPALRLSVRSDYTTSCDMLVRPGNFNTGVTAELWTDNGFSAPGPMRACHSAIVAALRGRLASGARVLDLGAGNGLLLARLQRVCQVDTLGVERNGYIEQQCAGEILIGDIADTPWMEWHPDTILLMPGRLLELSPDDAAVVRAHCLRARQLLIYAYSDNLGEDGLLGLTRRAGLDGPMLVLAHTPLYAIGVMLNRQE